MREVTVFDWPDGLDGLTYMSDTLAFEPSQLESQIEQEECTKEDRIKICNSVEMGQREDKCNAGVACDLPQVPLTERKTYA